MFIGSSCVSSDVFIRDGVEFGLERKNRLDEISVKHGSSGGGCPLLSDPSRNPLGKTMFGILGVSEDCDVKIGTPGPELSIEDLKCLEDRG
jgi:hypothetical protein